MDLFRQFRQHCISQHLVQPGDRLLLAVSGGLDSRVMLDLFCQLRKEWQLQLAVGHVNHQLRGAEADEDETFVKALAEASGLPFFSQRIEVPTYALAKKLSLETAARELRYQTLDNFREAWQAHAIVTAHTLDDQAETILDHLLRGSGLAGLAGMPAQRDTILRPLLHFSRRQLEVYAHSRQLTWREDRTNIDPQFRRNRIRHELLPLITARFNPQISRSLEHLSTIAGAADAYFRAEAETLLAEAKSRSGGLVKEKQPHKIILDIEQFWKYFYIIRMYIIRAVIKMVAGKEVEPTFTETARVLDLVQQSSNQADAAQKRFSKGKRFVWRNQIEVLIDHDGLVIQRLDRQLKTDNGQSYGRSLGAGNSTVLRVMIGERCMIPGTDMALLVERKALPQDWRKQVSPQSQFIDADKVKGELRLRFPQPGDRFVPLRSDSHSKAGSKKLSDFFTDLKVPLHQRRSVPVLECDEIVWICAYRIANCFKITPETRTVLHLQLLPQFAS
jgi:tRNA(Ile)-lysidine synthase